jgi:hypothetical protein
MIRTDELANQLIVKVREFFPKPVRESLTYKVEGGTNGTGGTIVIRGFFQNKVPQFESQIVTIFDGGAATEKKKDAVTITGKYQGVDCRILLRLESLAAVAQ